MLPMLVSWIKAREALEAKHALLQKTSNQKIVIKRKVTQIRPIMLKIPMTKDCKSATRVGQQSNSLWQKSARRDGAGDF